MTNPIITIDGPGGAGKGTAARRVAAKLGYRLLDSGALYRIVAYAAASNGINPDDGDAVAALVPTLQISFEQGPAANAVQLMLNGADVSCAIRSQKVADLASRVAVHTPVRKALLGLQRSFATPAGLVADGRDMATVVFTDAPLKIFLTASAQARAERRYKQLRQQGESVSITRLLEEIKARDRRDESREVAPLRPAEDSVLIDSTSLSIDEVVNLILQHVARL